MGGTTFPDSVLTENATLRAEIAALRRRMQRLSDSLACALDEIEGDDPAYKEKLVRRGRRLLIPESERVADAYSNTEEARALLSPQAAEPQEGGE